MKGGQYKKTDPTMSYMLLVSSTRFMGDNPRGATLSVYRASFREKVGIEGLCSMMILGIPGREES